MRQSFFKTFFLSFMICVFLLPSFTPVFANDLFPCSGTNVSDGNGFNNGRACSFADIVTVAKEIANRVVQIGLLLLPVILAYVGYLFITSADSPNKRNDAKKIGLNVIKGFAVMMFAWVIVTLILNALVCPQAFTNINVFNITGGGTSGTGGCVGY